MDGIYRQKQPGCRGHPALRSMKSVSSTGSLRHSASLVLGEASSTTCGTGAISFSDAGYPPSMSIRRQKQSTPFLKEVPARLEGCRQRLAAADHAMSQITAWEIGHEDEAEESKTEIPRSSGSMGYGLSEPAPEPPMQEVTLVEDALYNQADTESKEVTSQLRKIEQQLFGLDKRWQSVEKEREDWEALRFDLLEKLRASENKNHKLQKLNDEMHATNSSLADSETKLRTDLQQSENESEKLRQDLGVSEGEASALQSEISRYKSREGVLNTQLATLHARIYSAENDCELLRSNLEHHELGKGDLKHTLDNLQAAHEALTAAEASLREEHTQYVQETVALLAEKDSEIEQHIEHHDKRRKSKELHFLQHGEYMEALKAEKDAEIQEHINKMNLLRAEKDLELRRHIDRHARELDMIKAEKDDEMQVHIERSFTLQADLDEKIHLNKEAEEWKAVADERERELEQAMQRMRELEEALQQQGVGDKAKQLDLPLHEANIGDAVEVLMPPVANGDVLVFAPRCDMLLRMETAMAGKRSGSRPTQCQVDSTSRELRLLPLQPSGPPRIIKFDEITRVEQLGDTDVQIQWVPTSSAVDGSKVTLDLEPSDDGATSMLVAALTTFDRGHPGSSVATPDTCSPRTPGGSWN